MKIESEYEMKELQSIVFGSVVNFLGKYCIVVQGSYDADAKELPVVELESGQLYMVDKHKKLLIVQDARLVV